MYFRRIVVLVVFLFASFQSGLIQGELGFSASLAKKKKNSKCQSRDKGTLKGPNDNRRFVKLNDEMCREIEERFPNIHKKPWAILEWGDNGSYNCFAHSVGISDRPIKDLDVNPNGSPNLEHWDAFYAKHGLKKARGRVMSNAVVVMYGENKKRPGHAARISRIKIGETTMYESKLGPKQLLLHHVKGLNGGSYGKAIRSYK